MMNSKPFKPEVFRTFIDVISWEHTLNRLLSWGAAKESRYVCLCNVHVIVTAQRDDTYRSIINGADMATPDGMPVAWLLRQRGFSKQARISGPDLMWRLCEVAAQKEVAVFFYGSTFHTIKKLTTNLKRQFPDLKIGGVYSPPFRDLTSEEDQKITARINSSGAGIVFVALGCPKQEIWMAEHKWKINTVMLGVGAAFDFHAGTLRRAPRWMRNIGIEWFYRFIQEPRRLWRRYATTNSIFMWMVLKEYLRSNGKG